ncbi:MAG: hypothetical protein RI554_11595 [Trueperaceae bacterium]|nr:hypothetical protein [Trueperaceae bacterium]
MGIVPLLALAGDSGWASVIAPLVLLGTGVELGSAAIQAAALEAAGRERAGQAAGLHSTLRYVGSITGTSAMAAVLGPDPDAGLFRVLFAALAATALVPAAVSSALPSSVAPDD